MTIENIHQPFLHSPPTMGVTNSMTAKEERDLALYGTRDMQRVKDARKQALDVSQKRIDEERKRIEEEQTRLDVMWCGSIIVDKMAGMLKAYKTSRDVYVWIDHQNRCNKVGMTGTVNDGPFTGLIWKVSIVQKQDAYVKVD